MSNLMAEWENGEVAVLIDGLDEARLRVTDESFVDFLRDVARQSRSHGRQHRTFLFGRTVAILDAKKTLSHELGIDVPGDALPSGLMGHLGWRSATC